MHHNYLLTRAHTKSLATRTAKDTIIRGGRRAYTYSNSSYRRYLRDRRRPVAWLAADSVRTSTDSHRRLRNPLWIMDLLFDLRRPWIQWIVDLLVPSSEALSYVCVG